MKKTFVLMLLCACGVKTEDVQALEATTQQALDGVAVAMRAQNVELMLQAWAPERLPKSEKARHDFVEKFMERTRVGFMTFYGSTSPVVMGVEEGANGTLAVSISRDGTNATMSPKKLHFIREPDGHVLYAGAEETIVNPAVIGSQGSYTHITGNFDWYNQSPITHHMMTSWVAYQGAGNCLGCPVAPNSGGGTCTWPTEKWTAAGWSGTYTTGCLKDGNLCAVKLVAPNVTPCTCNGTYSCTADTTCCWQNPWDLDFWWGTYDISTNSWPWCSTAACPTP